MLFVQHNIPIGCQTLILDYPQYKEIKPVGSSFPYVGPLVPALAERRDCTLYIHYVQLHQGIDILPHIFDIHINDILCFSCIKPPRSVVFLPPISSKVRHREETIRNCLNKPFEENDSIHRTYFASRLCWTIQFMQYMLWLKEKTAKSNHIPSLLTRK